RRPAARSPSPRRLRARPAAGAAQRRRYAGAAGHGAHRRRRRARARRGGAIGRRAPDQALQPHQAHRPHRRDAGGRAAQRGRVRMTPWAATVAGGSGTRFWPLSTPERPKQLLPLVGDRPLVVQAVERLEGLVPPERILIITGALLAERIAALVPQVPRTQVLVEPRAASTAPALAWAAQWISRHDPGAQMLSLHADWAVDVAVLERTRRLAVVTGTFRWDDIGSWDALLRIRRADARGNVVVGNATVADDVRRSVIWAESEHLAVIGLEDTIVVRANGHT